jgi:hypothetical protein
MKKIIKLTEADLTRIIKRVIEEQKETISESNLTASLGGGFLKLTDGTKEKRGCVYFQKFEKDGYGKWKQVQEWAQGLTDIKGNSTAKFLGIPIPIKFNFSYAIKLAIPDSLEQITIPANEAQIMFDKWKSGESFVKPLYAKDGKKVDNEKYADTKFMIYFGGSNINSKCKSEWS